MHEKISSQVFYWFLVVVVVLIFCSWVKSCRATLFVLSASSCHQQLLVTFYLTVKIQGTLYIVDSVIFES